MRHWLRILFPLVCLNLWAGVVRLDVVERQDVEVGKFRSMEEKQIPAWLADYNAVAPHSALGYQSPQQYRSAMMIAGPMS